MSAFMRRIIPARAGFTKTSIPSQCAAADHPRSRGVYYNEIGHETIDQGSSPLARGLRLPGPHGPGEGRIIPARAGFTALGARDPGDGGGSSPLARGLLTRFLNATAEKRIIPARAGFTRGADASGEQVEDHPRSRGVYFNGLAERVSVEGSSPLARGLPPGGTSEHPDRGIIPARAGFTP